jgi:hypothetical protein
MIAKLYVVYENFNFNAALSKEGECAVLIIIQTVYTEWEIHFKVGCCLKNNIGIYSSFETHLNFHFRKLIFNYGTLTDIGYVTKKLCH